MPQIRHRGHIYDQDMLDTAQLILLEMQDENPKDFSRYGNRPSIITFARKFGEVHPDTSAVEKLTYFEAFMGGMHGTMSFDLETGKPLGR